ncbi:hypothetical protein BSBH6_04244 [Bacillus subtilis]|nr:hypothetical protein BSBH6_04244 [Bacillus subtilis]RPK19892.1 hypothetical protein BH5_04245 [Bacillus subtilis]
MNIIDIKYNKNEGTLRILCQEDNYNESNQIVLAKEKKHREIKPSSEILLEKEYVGDSTFSIIVNLKQSFSSFQLTEEKWLIKILSSNQKVNASKFSDVKFDYTYLNNSLFKIRPYITADNALAFYIRPIDIYPNIKEVKTKDPISLNVSLEGIDKINLRNIKSTLVLMKRDKVNLQYYNYELRICNLSSSTNDDKLTFEFQIDPKEIINNLKEEIHFDLFLEVENFTNSPKEIIRLKLSAEEYIVDIMNKSLEKYRLYDLETFLVSKQQIGLKIRVNAPAAALTGVENSIDKINFILEFDDVPQKNTMLVIKRRMKLANQFEYYNEIMYPLIKLDHTKYCFVINKNEFLSNQVLKGNTVWDTFLRSFDEDGSYYDEELLVDKQIKNHKFEYFYVSSSGQKINVKFFVNGRSLLSIYISNRNRVNSNATKIAVLGTCFSRNAFNTREYFNPNYKQYYECVYTQFHSSIISLVSEPIDINIDNLSGIRAQDKSYVKTDFQKDFFENLKEKSPDYLIIDLYPDASSPLIKYGETQYASASYILTDSDFFNKHTGFSLVEQTDFEFYFALYKKSIDMFRSKILKILPEDSIILNKGRFAYEFKDREKKIRQFGDKEALQRYNYFWDKVDNYFEYKFPKAKIIDLESHNFIADEDHPFGKSASHYESAYYKKFLDHLNQLLLENL